MGFSEAHITAHNMSQVPQAREHAACVAFGMLQHRFLSGRLSCTPVLLDRCLANNLIRGAGGPALGWARGGCWHGLQLLTACNESVFGKSRSVFQRLLLDTST